MKLTLATAALVMSLSGAASAATVNVNGYINVNFSLNTSASTLGAGYTASVGRYTGGALTNDSVFADINGSWTGVGSYVFATSAANNFLGSFKGPNLTFTDAAGLAGQNVWLWVSNGSNQNLLMRATGAAAGDFLFKADGDLPNSGNLDVSTAAVPGWTLSLGTFTTGGANAGYGGSYILNTASGGPPVPEPSAALLGAFGAIGLLRRRRN